VEEGVSLPDRHARVEEGASLFDQHVWFKNRFTADEPLLVNRVRNKTTSNLIEEI
jgi:hypothetical protein